MRTMTYRVVNLAPVLRSPRMGQVREFEVLSDQVLARICAAVDAYNDADTSWSSPDAAAGERTQRDSTATIQSVINGVPPGLKNAAIWEIRKYCDGADAVLDTVVKPGPGTPPAIPPSQDMVPSTDRTRPPEPPPPPNEYPPVATGQRGPGRGAFGWRPSVVTGQPGPGFTPPPSPPMPIPTGSEPEPEMPQPVPTGQQPSPPPPPPPYTPPPSVATPSVGCWYVMGKGYMWGERPSGGESTGLNQKDCQDLIARDLDVRGLSVQTPQGQTSQQTGTVNSTPSWNTAPGATRPQDNGVASVDCGPGKFWDGTKCRGSVSMPSLPGGIPGDSGGMTASTSFSDFNPGAVSATSFMGRRRVALRGVHSNGNLEWWSYQQAFLPQLFFAKRRANYATLGAGKPVPPGLCCQATDDGGAICSDGHGFPPTCPNKPEPNVPGVAQRINQDGYMVPKPPAAPVNGVCVVAGAPEKKAEEGGGVPPLLGLAAVGALVYALVESL